mgnify:CR=1 FL=1
MSLFFNRIYFQGTAASGGVKKTAFVKGLLRHIIVLPLTSSTVYDFYISDGSSLQLFGRESTTGELNETPQIPVQGNIELVVTGSTRDELFKIYTAIQEI